MLQTCAIIVTGTVQGVFFRQSTKEKAISLGVTGTVMNQEDGSVKIMATGTELQLEKLTRWCHQGPSRAKVEKVVVAAESLQAFKGFVVLR